MVTLKDIKVRAKQLGARVEDDKSFGFHECRVEAPHRKKWVCREVHEMIDSTRQPWKPDYADMLDCMNYGLEDCVGECDWCDDL